MTLIAIVLVVLVVAAGLLYNQRRWRPRQAAARSPGEGLKVGELTAPLATLAVLLLVFVLVQTFGSWTAAGRAERDRDLVEKLEKRRAYAARGIPHYWIVDPRTRRVAWLVLDPRRGAYADRWEGPLAEAPPPWAP